MRRVSKVSVVATAKRLLFPWITLTHAQVYRVDSVRPRSQHRADIAGSAELRPGKKTMSLSPLISVPVVDTIRCTAGTSVTA